MIKSYWGTFENILRSLLWHGGNFKENSSILLCSDHLLSINSKMNLIYVMLPKVLRGNTLEIMDSNTGQFTANSPAAVSW